MRTIKLLDLQEEHSLIRQMLDGDVGATHRLVHKHAPLVRSMALRYARHGVLPEDLEQEGALGLLDAAVRFDPSHGARFSTYARWWVRDRMQRYLRANRQMVPLPQTRALRRTRYRMRATFARMEQEAGGPVSNEAVAHALGVDLEDVLAVRTELSRRDVPVVESGERGYEPRSGKRSPEDEAARGERQRLAHRLVREALEHLDERERLIVTERSLSDEPVSLRELGERLAISSERVRQLETRAYAKIRQDIVARGGLETAHACAREAA